MTHSKTDKKNIKEKLNFIKKRNILFRTVLLSWLIILFSLGIFVISIISHQKKSLINHLESTARIISTSIAQVTATAVVTEDYSFVVDHCMKVVEERPSILYVVITRKDGFSLVHIADRWDQQNLDGLWKPTQTLTNKGDFIYSDLVKQEVFHHTYPFSYSGIDWGWIHIGMSLDQFNKEFKTVYRQTIWIALLCITVGFLLSYLFAKQLTRPISLLTEITQKVGAGDMKVRANIKTGDEFEVLANSFNQMSATLSLAMEKEKEAKEQALYANQAKSRLLANISHELRTPLHGIISFADLGIEKYPTVSQEKIMDYFDEIKQNGFLLLNLVNDLLDLSKLESGRMEFNFSKADIWQTVKKVANEFQPINTGREVEIRFFETEINPIVQVDPVRICQVIRNLISNAIKFSKDNEKIDIGLEEDGDYIKIFIKDYGVGIPEGELESVFDAFIQSSKTRTGAGGTGLGLSICKEIITAHGGRIWAEHNPDGGSIFYLTLPKSLEKRMKIGEILIAEGIVTEKDLEKGLKKQKHVDE